MMIPFEFYGVMSAFSDKYPYELNKRRHLFLCEVLTKRGYEFELFDGAWEGKREKAIKIRNIKPDVLEALGRSFDQECVLYLGPGVRKMIRV